MHTPSDEKGECAITLAWLLLVNIAQHSLRSISRDDPNDSRCNSHCAFFQEKDMRGREMEDDSNCNKVEDEGTMSLSFFVWTAIMESTSSAV